MFGSMGQSAIKNLGNGGEMDGNVTITGDLEVQGGISLSVDEVIQGTSTIDVTNTEALLVRKNDDGGDVFVVDTTNSGVGVNTSAGGWGLNVKGADANVFKVQASDGNTLSFLQGTNGDATQKWFADGNVTKVLINTNGDSYFTGGSLGVGTASPPDFPAENVTIEGATAGLVLRDTTGSNQATQFFTLYSSNGDIIGMFDDSKSLKFGHADDAVGTNYEDVLVITSDGNVNIGSSSSKTNNVGSSARGITIANATTPVLSLWDTTNAGYHSHFYQVEGNSFIRSSGSLTIQTNAGTTALTLDTSQNATFAGKVAISSAFTAGELLGVKGDTGGADWGARIENTHANGLGALVKVASSGTGQALEVRSGSTSLFKVLANGTSTFAGDVFIKNSGSNDPSTLSLWSADTSIADDDNIGVILAQGSDSGGSPPYTGAKIEFNADAVWDTGTSNYYATRIDFFTQSNNGTDTLANPALTIDSSQNATFAGDVTVNGDTLSLVKSNNNAFLKIESTDGGEAIFEMRATTNRTNQIRFFEGATQRGSIVYAHASQSLTFNTGDSATAKLVLDDNSRISLSNNNGGTNNTVFGKLAGNDLNANAGFNVLIGEDAGGSLTGGTNSADENCIIGSNAVDTSTDAFRVTAIGTSVMRGALTTATEGTVGIGYLALNVLTSGAGNTAVGYESLKANQQGDYNTAIGYESLESNIDGGDNTAVGYRALAGLNIDSSDTSASYNTAIGARALDGATTGTHNTVIGADAMGSADGAETENTAIGYKAGFNINNGTSNVCIGSNSLLSAVNGTNQIVIGKDATGVADNSVTLGNASVTNLYVAPGNSTAQNITFRDTADSGRIQYDHSDDSMKFQVASVINARVYNGSFQPGADDTQDLGTASRAWKTLYVKDGVNFPDDASANPSSDANTLDNYEEGYHEPTLTGSSTAGTIGLSSGSNTLSYTKIGRQVTVNGLLGITSVSGSPAGSLKITLPFTIADLTDNSGRFMGNAMVLSTTNDNVNQQSAIGVEGDAFVKIFRTNTNNLSEDVAEELGGDEYIYVGFTYFTS